MEIQSPGPDDLTQSEPLIDSKVHALYDEDEGELDPFDRPILCEESIPEGTTEIEIKTLILDALDERQAFVFRKTGDYSSEWKVIATILKLFQELGLEDQGWEVYRYRQGIAIIRAEHAPLPRELILSLGGKPSRPGESQSRKSKKKKRR